MNELHNTKNITEKKLETDIIHDFSFKLNITQFAMGLYENLPECNISFHCTEWNYGDGDPKKFRSTLVDLEDEDKNGNPKKYIVDIKKAEKGVIKAIDLILSGKLHVGINSISEIMDLCNWDGFAIDACLQCAVFGEVVYG